MGVRLPSSYTVFSYCLLATFISSISTSHSMPMANSLSCCLTSSFSRFSDIHSTLVTSPQSGLLLPLPSKSNCDDACFIRREVVASSIPVHGKFLCTVKMSDMHSICPRHTPKGFTLFKQRHVIYFYIHSASLS